MSSILSFASTPTSMSSAIPMSICSSIPMSVSSTIPMSVSSTTPMEIKTEPEKKVKLDSVPLQIGMSCSSSCGSTTTITDITGTITTTTTGLLLKDLMSEKDKKREIKIISQIDKSEHICDYNIWPSAEEEEKKTDEELGDEETNTKEDKMKKPWVSIIHAFLEEDKKTDKVEVKATGEIIKMAIAFYTKFGANAKNIGEERMEKSEDFEKVVGKEYKEFIEPYFKDLYAIEVPEVYKEFDKARSTGAYDDNQVDEKTKRKKNDIMVDNMKTILKYHDILNTTAYMGVKTLCMLCVTAFAKYLIGKSMNAIRMARSAATKPEQILDPKYGPETWDERDARLADEKKIKEAKEKKEALEKEAKEKEIKNVKLQEKKEEMLKTKEEPKVVKVPEEDTELEIESEKLTKSTDIELDNNEDETDL